MQICKPEHRYIHGYTCLCMTIQVQCCSHIKQKKLNSTQSPPTTPHFSLSLSLLLCVAIPVYSKHTSTNNTNQMHGGMGQISAAELNSMCHLGCSVDLQYARETLAHAPTSQDLSTASSTGHIRRFVLLYFTTFLII